MSAPQTPAERALDLYRRMLTIRRFEEECARLRNENEIAGSIHLCCGQEAIPVGASLALRDGDVVVATYRGHGWAIEAGLPLDALFAEICGRATGVNGGRGGSPYLSAPAFGFFGENSIVGGGLPIACGLGLAGARDDRAVVVSFGDGATSQGAAHEAMVMAVSRRLPVVFVCENNGWSEMTPIAAIVPLPSLADRGPALGMPGERIDGDDPEVVEESLSRAVNRARSGEGPSLVECCTHRLLGHYNADVEHYRPAADRDAAEAADTLKRMRGRLLDKLGVATGAVESIELEVGAHVEEASRTALAAPLPDPATAALHVVAPVRIRPHRASGGSGVEELRYLAAAREAIARELRERPDAVYFGEDVAVPGGVFGATRGLLEQFGADRIFDTPIAESAILGTGVGAALGGLRPIVEIMWADFLLVALDQLVNQAANVRYLHSGELTAPLVVRCQQGVTPGSCAQHSQSLEALLAHVPGLKVGLPATPQDAYAMLRAAVADEDPCIVVEARSLYQLKGPVDLDGPLEPVGGAIRRRRGEQITLITWGTCVQRSLEAAERLADDGVEAGVLDLRWLNPLDDEAIAACVAETNRVVVVHEANVTGGFGAEVAARIGERHFDSLDGPVLRIGAPDVRFPAAPVLQRALLPNATDIAATARALL